MPHEKTLRKPLRKWSRKWLRVFTKGFTAENVKIFYDKLTSSGMTVHTWVHRCRYPPPHQVLSSICSPRKRRTLASVQFKHWHRQSSGGEFVVKNHNIFSSKSFGKNPCRFSCRFLAKLLPQGVKNS